MVILRDHNRRYTGIVDAQADVAADVFPDLKRLDYVQGVFLKTRKNVAPLPI